MKIGEFFKAKRHNAGLTCRGLEKLSGISFSYISQVERGKKEPSFITIANLLKALKITWLEFTAATGHANELDAVTEKLVQVVAKLSPADRVRLLKHAEDAQRVKTVKKAQ